MTRVRCESCGAELKFDPEKLAGRTSARCARCKATINLAGALTSNAVVGTAASVVTCGTCGTRSKLPEGANLSRARCPKCRGEVSMASARVVETPAAHSSPRAETQSVGAPATSHDDSSGATRRLDSRALGIQIAAMGGALAGSESRATSLDQGTQVIGAGRLAEPGTEPSPATRLLRPPMEALIGAAEQIREAAEELGQAAIPPGKADEASAVSEPVPDTPAPDIAGTAEEAVTRKRPMPAARSVARDAARRRDAQPFPAVRGLVCGLIAGSITGGAWLAILLLPQGSVIHPFAAPLPPIPRVPEVFLRVALPALLGAVAGFLAAAANSPRRSDHPLRLVRSLTSALLIGLVAGLTVSFFSRMAEGGSLIWPAGHWIRDLLLVGLLTPAVNRLITSRPT